MKRGSKRQTEGDGPTAPSRRRLRDGDEEAELQRLKEEEESARRQRKIQKAQEDGDDEDDWVDADDEEEDEEDNEGYMDPADYIQGNEAEEEEEIIDDGDEEDEDYADFQRETAAITSGMRRVTFSDEAIAAADAAASNEDGDGDAAPSIWRSDMQEKGHGSEQLAYANKAYDSFFQLRTEYPCLSFDVVRDATATMRYPLALTLVCGSQAEDPSKNKLYVLRVSNICRTKHDVDSDGDSEESYIGDEGDSEGDEDDEGEEEVNNGEPIVHHRTISHYGAANRVRCAPHNTSLVAVWSDAGHVQVFDLSSDVAALCDTARWLSEQARLTGQPRPSPLLFCTPSTAHRTEGYGLGWSPVAGGTFASGDCAGGLFVWRPGDAGRWRAAASSTPGEGEAAASVEEIQWSPTQADVLIAARAGGTVEVWDTRDMRSSKISWRADPTDINVADWNRARQASHLLATGAESGAAAVWDLRRVAEAQPIQRLSWHRGSITSVEFSPHNESVLSLTGDDGQCTLWDLSLERDPGEEEGVIGELFGRPDLTGIPDQLMFQHQGLEHPKEAHWHAQIPGMVVTTDYLGLHLFRPMNWRSLMK